MSDISPLPPPEPTYQAIEATLAGHEPGRRFLAEHARRSRHEESAALLDAVARLHERSAARPGGLETDLATLRDLTATAEASLAEATTTARSDDDDVFDMVEGLQETAWRMRETGTDAPLCDLLDGLAARLGRACRGREQRDFALDRAKDAVARLRLHLAGLPTGQAEAGGEPDGPATGGAEIAGSNSPVAPNAEDPVLAADPEAPAPARPKRKSRTRIAG